MSATNDLETADVVVVGAGFAGITAARELARTGKRVVVLDARDRLGGRTWLAERLGKPLELGGTWVHWTQPYVWAELKRYGIGTVASPEPVHASWQTTSGVRHGDPSEMLAILDDPNQRLTAESRAYFPEPFAPLAGPNVAGVDAELLQDRIDALGLDTDTRMLMDAFWTLNFNGPLASAGFSQALRWVALTNGDWKVNFEACATYKLEGGTRRLIEAIANDVQAPIRLNSLVTAIEQNDDGCGAVVRLADGSNIHTTAVIVTAGLHALSGIVFRPPLEPAKQAAVARGQVSRGTKIWLKVAGPVEPFVAFGDASWPLNFFQADVEMPDGDRLVIAFGPDQDKIDPTDVRAAEEILQRLRPDLIVREVAAHDWLNDPLARETWAMQGAGFLSGPLAAMQRPDGVVVLAGSDIASGWGGFIDGAIESGLDAALKANALCANAKALQKAGNSCLE
ncbi:FAD-dependent oxidoreductase [Cryobacterium sp. TMT1-2-2]|uniref:flavin monoamine oxidase family protein n=1 Tax=Cryobacterium sp. TMT1-2-2 TaxID=1259233 RepID=UPI00106B6865|nr:NAD(P)/FAD-dependent oxidoreductase [Cryobacterium sp. TMT1-2-2]TFD11654.1 FAD-dependent oxidoreductase [Cryobacterium sp. TMT1-2-2]